MTSEQTFTASEAATITTVSGGVQLEWRRRGFLPDLGGKWARFSTRELCRMRLLKAMVDHPTAIKDDVQHVTDDLLDSMESMLIAKRSDSGTPPAHAEMLAVIAFGREGYRYSVVFDFADVQRLHNDDGVFDFTTMMVINLAALARQMAEKIELVDVDRGIDRRIETLDEEMANRGI